MDDMIKTHYRACHICEAICGLEIRTQGEEIISIKGDKNDPLSRGHICPKAVALRNIHEDPDRLRKPLKKVVSEGGAVEWREISWEEALDTTARHLAKTINAYGDDAVGLYQGNPTGHNFGLMTHLNELFQHISTKNQYTASSIDQLPHHLTSLWLFGHRHMLPIPDVDNTDFMLMLGANPLVSNGSMWTVPDVKKRLKALQERGGKLIVIDPRRTETAKLADEHHFIRPGTDALFLLAILHTLFAEELVAPGRLSEFIVGLDELEDPIQPFTAEFAAQHTGIDAEDIRRIARELAGVEHGICYGRMGVSTQRFGGLCQWLTQIINIATGNLDRPGGSLFTTPAVDVVAGSTQGSYAEYRSRVRSLPEANGELPSTTLADEMLTPGDGQIRAFFSSAGNPVLSVPNGRQLEKGLQQLDFMVSLDPYMNETTCHADIILPPTSPLEHDHYDLVFLNWGVRNTARYNPPIFDKPEGSLHDWEILSELGRRLPEYLDNPPQIDTSKGFVSLDGDGDGDNAESPAMPIPPHTLIDMGLQAGAYGEQGLSLEKLRQNPSGVDLGPLKTQIPERLATKDKRIHCATPEPLADLQRLLREFQQADEKTLRLIGRRGVRDNNSWMHNYYHLIKGKERCTLLMHPTDMAVNSIVDGGEVLLGSRVGSVKVCAIASEDMMPGVVCMPHGYGHHRSGTRTALASENAGVSFNDVSDDLYIDELTANAVVNGVPVEVTPA